MAWPNSHPMLEPAISKVRLWLRGSMQAMCLESSLDQWDHGVAGSGHSQPSHVLGTLMPAIHMAGFSSNYSIPFSRTSTGCCLCYCHTTTSLLEDWAGGRLSCHHVPCAKERVQVLGTTSTGAPWPTPRGPQALLRSAPLDNSRGPGQARAKARHGDLRGAMGMVR